MPVMSRGGVGVKSLRTGRAAGLLALLAVPGLVACVPGEIKDADRPLLVTVADLEPYGFDPAAYSGGEVFSRTRYLDGSLEIDYELDSSEGQDPLYLSTTAGFERSNGDAVATYAMEKRAFGVGLELGGGEIQEVPGFYEWGDDTYFALIVAEGSPVGNVFGARSGRRIYWLLVSGLYFDADSRDEWEAFISPKLEYLESYEPGW